MNRREFWKGAAVLGAGLAVGPPVLARSVRRPLFIDGLCALGISQVEGKLVPSEALVDAIRSRHLDLGSFTMAPVGNVPDAFEKTVQRVAAVNNLAASYPELFFRVTGDSDLAKAGKGKLGLIYNLQDTVALEGDPARVATLKSLGILIIQLTYNKRNLAGDGCLERSNAGLSDFGRSVIEEMNQEKVLLDLSHAAQRTIAEGIAHSKAAPIISHTGCRDLVDYPRNTFDAELRALADKGGVAGIYMMPFLRKSGQPTRHDFLAHLVHAVNVCGEDHVSIGTDNPLLPYTLDDAARQQQHEFYASRVRAGVAAPGEKADVFNIVEGYNRSDRFEALEYDLRMLGWRAGRIEKILGLNFLRLLKQTWTA